MIIIDSPQELTNSPSIGKIADPPQLAV